MQQPEIGAGEEPEHAPVNGHVETRNAQIFFIGLQEIDPLGTGKDARCCRESRARRKIYWLGDIAGLEGVFPLTADQADGTFKLHGLVRNDRGHPVFVGDAHPAARARAIGFVTGIHGAVFLVENIGAHHADRAFMQNEEGGPGGRRFAIAAHARETRQAGGLARRVLDLVGEGEHIVVVERNRAAEDKAVTAAIFQYDRRFRRQLIAGDEGPVGVEAGRIGRAGTQPLPAILCVKSIGTVAAA